MKVNYDMMLAGLRKAVEEKGEDYLYPRDERREQYKDDPEMIGDCRYVHDGKPDCIGGQVYHALGMPIEQLRLSEGNSIDYVQLMVPGEGDELEAAEVTDKAKYLVRRAQQYQDNYSSWGDALAQAIDYIGTLQFDENENYTGLQINLAHN